MTAMICFELYSARDGNVRADHGTLNAGEEKVTPLLSKYQSPSAGRADDGPGLQFRIVEIHGPANRPDGSANPFCSSPGSEREPRKSHAVLRTQPWDRVSALIEIALEPGSF